MEPWEKKDHLEVCADVLQACNPSPALTSTILLHANLRGRRWKRYRALLTNRGLLEASMWRMDITYQTTEKGRHFLNLFGELRRLLEEPGTWEACNP